MSERNSSAANPRNFLLDGSDFYTFFVPGAVLFLFICIAFIQDIDPTFAQFSTKLGAMSAQEYIIYAFAGTFMAYLLGHIAGALSVLLIDRIYIQKVVRYPYVKLLFPEEIPESFKKRDDNIKGNFYRVILSMFLLFIILFCTRNLISNWPCMIVLFCILAIIVHRWVALPSTNNKDTFPQDYKKAYYNLSIPMYGLENLIRRSWGFDKSLNLESVNKYKNQFYARFGMHPRKELETDNYWLPYLYIMEYGSAASKAYLKKMISTFCFLRNMSASLMISAVILSITKDNVEILGMNNSLFALLLILASLTLSIRFYYFYYNYFSKSVFRLFIILEAMEDSIPTPEHE